MHLIHSNQVVSVPPNAAVKKLVEGISEKELRDWVKQLALPRHFVVEPEQNRRTADLILQCLERLGFRVARQGRVGNIIALPPKAVKELALVVAHYDSVPGCSGADDNASAVAALLVAARCCAEFDRNLPVAFLAVNREEDGFLGSIEFVEMLTIKAPFRVRCAHVLEMLGYASSFHGSQGIPSGLPIQLGPCGDFLGLLANNHSDTEMGFVMERVGAYAGELPVTGLRVADGAERVLPVLARSDHVPFWHRNIPALMWTDTAEFRNPNYHLPSDTPETLDYGFLRSVTMLLAGCVLDSAIELAGGRKRA